MIRNILICTAQVPFTTGGAELHVEGLRRAFVEEGYNAEVVALPFKWYPPDQIMKSALAWRLLDLSEANGKKIDLVVGMKFPAYLAEHERKVLWIMHQHRSAYNLWGTQFDDLSTQPDGPRVREWIHHCDNQFIPRARKVFANSQTVADRLLKFNNIKSEPLYHPPPRAGSIRTGAQGDFVLYPGRVEAQKRQELLIEAAHLVKSPIKIILAGTCANRNYYEGLIRKYDVGDKVQLAGFVDEPTLLDLYANALGICYLPFDEDYGYVTLEGMLAAKPVIVAVDGGGATEFVDHRSTGLVIPPDPHAIAEAFDELHENREQARKMGALGREKLQSMNLSWKNVVERIVSAAL
ncbi:MAG TPA: glycosyltransferase family 4 protein [Pyrinomonadaceae bacterium]|nr:glycosyltransferase family 4 protein [Pyrinomonadaceae bacterium]